MKKKYTLQEVEEKEGREGEVREGGSTYIWEATYIQEATEERREETVNL